MNSKDDGGSAFPIPLDDRPGAYSADPGMSLRDYFAAKAMPGVHAEYLGLVGRPPLTRDDYHNIAADSYTLADAMLKARA